MDSTCADLKKATIIIFVILVTSCISFSHCYYIRQTTSTDASQIDPILAMPYLDTRYIMKDDNEDDTPIVLRSPKREIEYDVLIDGEDLKQNSDGCLRSAEREKNAFVRVMSDMLVDELQHLQADSPESAESAESSEEFPEGIDDSEKEVPGEPLTPQDFFNAKHLEIEEPPQDENSPDPILSAGLFEGDIAGVNFSDFSPYERNAIKDMDRRWPGRVVPYVISSAFDMRDRSVIAKSVLDYHTQTCVRFVPRTTQKNYIHFLRGTGCSSQIGRRGGSQHISLATGCVYKGIVEHEIMHALGFWHEQSRGDRDDYVSIVWKNIVPGMEHNFNKYSWQVVQSMGVEYDTGSLMHYGRFAFSRDHFSPTIIPRNPSAHIGQRRGFSQRDLLKINKLYECQKEIVPTIKPPTTPVECSDHNQLCGYWAKSDECEKNPAWMHVNCAKSCEVCEKQCGNFNKNCKVWAKAGECTKNPDYMLVYCPMACEVCEVDVEEYNVDELY